MVCGVETAWNRYGRKWRMKHLNAGEYIAAQQEQIDRLQAELQEKTAMVTFPDDFVTTFRMMAAAVHNNAADHGWWDTERNDGEMIALMHSELSETLEAIRRGNPNDDHCPEFCSAVVEFADVLIRVMDTCHQRGWPLAEAILAKHEYNVKRPYKHGGKLF